MGKTIFTDNEILMFVRFEMGSVMLRSEMPEIDDTIFEGPWHSASESPDIDTTASKLPSKPRPEDVFERKSSKRRSTLTRYSALHAPTQRDGTRPTASQARDKTSQIANHLREVFVAGTSDEARNTLYESNANLLLDEMGGNLYRYFLRRLEDENDLEWLDENILELATSHKQEALKLITGDDDLEELQKKLWQAHQELGVNSAQLDELSQRYRSVQYQLNDLAVSLSHQSGVAMSEKFFVSLNYSLQELGERLSEMDKNSAQTLASLADLFASMSAPKNFLHDLGFSPKVKQNPYIMRRLKEHMEDLSLLQEQMDNVFGKDN